MINKNLVTNVSVWTVWYEDRFATGAERDRASIVALFLDKAEAESYIATHEGSIDIASGKFDGLFLKHLNATELIEANLVTAVDIQKLISQVPPARLKKHWEKGWI
jgi:hypothetical protein